MFLFDISETVINSFYTINTLNNVYDFYAVFFIGLLTDSPVM